MQLGTAARGRSMIPPVVSGGRRRAGSPASRFLDQRRSEREQEALGLARARSARNDHVLPGLHGCLYGFILMGVEFLACGKEALVDEGREVADKTSRPRSAKDFRRCGRKGSAATDIRRQGLDQRLAVEPPVAVEHPSALFNQGLVAQVEGAIEIPHIGVAELAEEGNRIGH